MLHNGISGGNKVDMGTKCDRSRARRTIIGGAVALIACLLAAPAGAGAGARLGGLWLIDEGAGQVVRDRSGNGNHGTLGSASSADSNDPSWIPGAFRKTSALRFGGDDFVTVPDSPSLESARITVGAVVRASASPGSYRYIASKGAIQCLAASYGLYTGADGGLIFYISNGSSFTLSPNAGTTIWDGRWHIVAGTFDGATVRLYVDGSEVGTGSPSTLTTKYGLADDDRFYVGDYGGPCAVTLGFIGDIDAVGVLQDVVAWRPSA